MVNPNNYRGGLMLMAKQTLVRCAFFQEYTKRDANQVLALLSQFSLGIDVFDATINSDDEPDSKFLAWRGTSSISSTPQP